MSLLLLFDFPGNFVPITYFTTPINLNMTDKPVYASTNDDTINLKTNDTEINI